MDLKATLPPWALIEMCYRLPQVSLPLLREGQDPSEVANRYGRNEQDTKISSSRLYSTA